MKICKNEKEIDKFTGQTQLDWFPNENDYPVLAYKQWSGGGLAGESLVTFYHKIPKKYADSKELMKAYADGYSKGYDTNCF